MLPRGYVRELMLPGRKADTRGYCTTEAVTVGCEKDRSSRKLLQYSTPKSGMCYHMVAIKGAKEPGEVRFPRQ